MSVSAEPSVMNDLFDSMGEHPVECMRVMTEDEWRHTPTSFHYLPMRYALCRAIVLLSSSRTYLPRARWHTSRKRCHRETTNGNDSYRNYPAFAFCIVMNHDPENNMEWYLPSDKPASDSHVSTSIVISIGHHKNAIGNLEQSVEKETFESSIKKPLGFTPSIFPFPAYSRRCVGSRRHNLGQPKKGSF